MPRSAAGRTNRFLQAKRLHNQTRSASLCSFLRGRTTGPSRTNRAPRQQSDVLGRDTGPFRPRGLEMPRARGDAQPPTPSSKNNPHLREDLTHGVDRRPDLAQHLQHARGVVPPLQRVLELPEVEDDVP